MCCRPYSLCPPLAPGLFLPSLLYSNYSPVTSLGLPLQESSSTESCKLRKKRLVYRLGVPPEFPLLLCIVRSRYWRLRIVLRPDASSRSMSRTRLCLPSPSSSNSSSRRSLIRKQSNQRFLPDNARSVPGLPKVTTSLTRHEVPVPQFLPLLRPLLLNRSSVVFVVEVGGRSVEVSLS